MEPMEGRRRSLSPKGAEQEAVHIPVCQLETLAVLARNLYLYIALRVIPKACSRWCCHGRKVPTADGCRVNPRLSRIHVDPTNRGQVNAD